MYNDTVRFLGGTQSTTRSSFNSNSLQSNHSQLVIPETISVLPVYIFICWVFYSTEFSDRNWCVHATSSNVTYLTRWPIWSFLIYEHYCFLKFHAVYFSTNVPHASIFRVEHLDRKFLQNIRTFLPKYAVSSYNNSLHIRRHENLWSTLFNNPNYVSNIFRIKKFLIMQLPLSSNSFTSLTFKQRIISQLCL